METRQSRQLLAENGAEKTEETGRRQAGEPNPAFQLYVQSCREEFRKLLWDDENSRMSVEFTNMCGLKWQGMSEEEKTMHSVELAEKYKKRYEEEMANYNKEKVEERTENPNPPQRAVSAFLWFNSDERPKVKTAMPDGTFVEIANEVRRRWNECSQDVRNKYEALAAKDKERYERELEAYKEKFGEDEEGNDVAEAAFGRGEKPRGLMTPFAFFVQTRREEMKKKNPNKPVVHAENCFQRWTVVDIVLTRGRPPSMLTKDKNGLP